MWGFEQLPPELFYQIALHLPLTKDVLDLSLTNSRIRGALSTPALFKARLALRGWDVSAWEDEDDAAHSPGDFERWMSIDHTYCRTVQLFDEATVAGYFLIIPDSPIDGDVLWNIQPADTGQDNQSPNSRAVFDGQKTVIWLEKLSRVLPLFVTHHRGENILRITEETYHNVLRSFTRVVGDLCAVVRPIGQDGIPESPQPRIASSRYRWFEPVCLSLIALLIQCDATTIVSIFTNTWMATYSPQSTFCVFVRSTSSPLAVVLPDALTFDEISERYFGVFFFQAILFVALHLNAARPGRPQPLLLAPSLPHFDPSSSSSYNNYFVSDEPLNIADMGTTTAPSSSSRPLRPWLRNKLTGTPLADLSSTTGRAWAGYYTVLGSGVRDPPMFLELRSTPPPLQSDADADSESDCVYFGGEGHDGVGIFTIMGVCDTRTGAVSAIKRYSSHWWEWRGMVTPFGMTGMWGPGWSGGWWWIWPQEWSPTTTRRHD